MTPFQKLITSVPFVLLLTFLSLFLTSLLQGNISLQIITFTAFVVALQLSFSAFLRAYTILLPLEWMTTRVGQYYSQSFRYLAALMAGLPLLASVSMNAAVVLYVLLLILGSKSLVMLMKLISKRKQLRATSIRNIKQYSPEVVVYMSGLGNVAYQINQWLPVMDRLDQRCMILIRERTVYEKMQPTEHPVVFARSQLDVEAILKASPQLKVILYPANTQKNFQSLRHYEYQHYFINHGESDKAVNQSKVLMAYDKLLVGGALAERRMTQAGLPLRTNQVVHVGRPQAELLLQTITEPQPIKTLLYAPTWEGFVDDVNYSSVNEQGYRMLQDLKKSGVYRILFKPHPYTGEKNKVQATYLKKMKDLCDGKTLQLVDSMSGIHECMNQSDLMITDISSVLNEYLITCKPIILCNTRHLSDETMARQFPSSRAAYLFNPEHEIISIMKQIKSEDRLWQQRFAIRLDSLGNPDESAMERFQAVLTKACMTDTV